MKGFDLENLTEVLKEHIGGPAYEYITRQSSIPNSFELCGDDIRGQNSLPTVFMRWSDADEHTHELLPDLTASMFHIVIKGI